MRHPTWYRAFIALWGLWITAALSDAAGVHACAMHGGAIGHAAMSHAGHHAAPSHGSVPQDKNANVCTCLGACCSVPAIGMPPAPAVLPTAAIIEFVPAGQSVVAAPVVHRPHALPFANGPPAASVAPTL